MTTKTLTALAAATLLASCATAPTRGTVTPDQLAAITTAPLPEGSMVKIEAKVTTPSGENDFGPLSVVTYPEKTATMEIIRELIYPTSYALPEAKEGVLAVTPTSPEAFATANTGWTFKLQAEKRPGTVLVTGTATFVTHDGFADAPGEPFSPILSPDGVVVSENRAQVPHLVTYTTPVLVAASTQGKPYRLPLSHPEDGTVLELTVHSLSPAQ